MARKQQVFEKTDFCIVASFTWLAVNLDVFLAPISNVEPNSKCPTSG